MKRTCWLSTRSTTLFPQILFSLLSIQHFAIKNWAISKDVYIRYIHCALSIPDGLEKARCWVLRSCQASYNMIGHFIKCNTLALILLL